MQGRTLQVAALLAVSLLTGRTACAQSTHMGMPEGSSELWIAAGIGHGPEAEGSNKTAVFPVLLAGMRWSNGMFVNMSSIGMHLSDHPTLHYGVQLAPRKSSNGSGRSRWTPQVGGFVDYQIAEGVGLTSALSYGSGWHRRGIDLELGAYAWTSLSAHQHLGIDTRLVVANRSALATDGVVPGKAAGVRNAALGLHWRWQFSPRYGVWSLVRHDWRSGDAAAGEQARPRRLQAATMLTISF